MPAIRTPARAPNPAALALLGSLLLQPGLVGQDRPTGPAAIESIVIDELPGYYEFYTKTGRQETLRQERRRDQQIAAGTLVPLAVDQPLPELSLPLPAGGDLDFLDYRGKKNLVVVSFRSWW